MRKTKKASKSLLVEIANFEMISRNILGKLEVAMLNPEIEPFEAYCEWIDELPTLLNASADIPGSTEQMRIALRGLSIILDTGFEMVKAKDPR